MHILWKKTVQRILKAQRGLRKQSSRDYETETACTPIQWCGKADNSSYLPLPMYTILHRYTRTSCSLVSTVIASYVCVVKFEFPVVLYSICRNLLNLPGNYWMCKLAKANMNIAPCAVSHPLSTGYSFQCLITSNGSGSAKVDKNGVLIVWNTTTFCSSWVVWQYAYLSFASLGY